MVRSPVSKAALALVLQDLAAILSAGEQVAICGHPSEVRNRKPSQSPSELTDRQRFAYVSTHMSLMLCSHVLRSAPCLPVGKGFVGLTTLCLTGGCRAVAPGE